MGPSMPYPNAERAYELWARGEHVSAHWDPAALDRGWRPRRIIPATVALAISLRLVPLLLIVVIGALLVGR